MTRQAAAALPQAPARSASGSHAGSSGGKGPAAAPKWNVHPTSTKACCSLPHTARRKCPNASLYQLRLCVTGACLVACPWGVLLPVMGWGCTLCLSVWSVLRRRWAAAWGGRRRRRRGTCGRAAGTGPPARARWRACAPRRAPRTAWAPPSSRSPAWVLLLPLPAQQCYSRNLLHCTRWHSRQQRYGGRYCKEPGATKSCPRSKRPKLTASLACI